MPSHICYFYFLIFVFVLFHQQATQIDNDLKARASAYNNLKGNLQNLERKNAWVNGTIAVGIIRVTVCDLRRLTMRCLRFPLGGACWPGVWLTSWRRRTLSWTPSTWLPCWSLCQSKCTSLVLTHRSCSFSLRSIWSQFVCQHRLKMWY